MERTRAAPGVGSPCVRSEPQPTGCHRDHPCVGDYWTQHRGPHRRDGPERRSGSSFAHASARPSALSSVEDSLETNEANEEISSPFFKQPETRPISQDQLVAEVKGIYAGLVMVESKCIEVCRCDSFIASPTYTGINWKNLAHKTRNMIRRIIS